MSDLYLPILYGTVREGRRTIGVARFALERLSTRPGVETRLFDPRDLPFDNLVAREWEVSPRDPKATLFVQEMARADGFVLVTPEYNHGIPGTLKNLIDHLYDQWVRKPFGIVSAGGHAGGLRAAEQLRMVAAGVEAIAIPAQISVVSVEDTWDDQGPKSSPDAWARRFDRFYSELEWYARALKSARMPA
jgi:NAD(P)H-dependent FMN reductase